MCSNLSDKTPSIDHSKKRRPVIFRASGNVPISIALNCPGIMRSSLLVVPLELTVPSLHSLFVWNSERVQQERSRCSSQRTVNATVSATRSASSDAAPTDAFEYRDASSGAASSDASAAARPNSGCSSRAHPNAPPAPHEGRGGKGTGRGPDVSAAPRGCDRAPNRRGQVGEEMTHEADGLP
jgi:hypothetical protein